MKGITVVNLLIWKPIIKKINPEKIGYVCENGQINFQTTEVAEEFTKNTIVNALKKGFERRVISKDNKILLIKDGTKDEVGIKFSEFPKIVGCTDSHGHPGGGTFTSYDIYDFYDSNKILGYNKFKVYNINGESCTLTLEGKPITDFVNDDGCDIDMIKSIKFELSKFMLNIYLKLALYLLEHDKKSIEKGYEQIKEAVSKKQIEIPRDLIETEENPLMCLLDIITEHKFFKRSFNVPGKMSYSSDYSYVKPFENKGPGWT